MSDFLISDFFEPIIDDLCTRCPKLKTSYDKVKWRFIEFAALRGRSLDSLRLYDLCNLSGEINVKFTGFLNSVTRRKVGSHRPHYEFKREVWTIARRIVSAVTGQKNAGNDLSIAERKAPSWMEPILDVLPRDLPRNLRRKIKKEGTRRNYPLTINGEMLLESFLAVSKNYDIRSFEMLSPNFIGEIRAEIRKTPRGISPEKIICSLNALARKLGLTNKKQESQALKYVNWPLKLKQQYDVYKKLAAEGVDVNSALGFLAEPYKIKYRRLKTATIKRTQINLERGLGHCGPLPEDFGIEDLLILKERKISLFDVERIEKYNEIVQRYREREQNRENNDKQAGFDTVSFALFKNAVMSLAKYNGFFSLLTEFNKEYTVRIDTESKLSRKARKKAAFPLKDIDWEIEKLGERYFKAVRDKSFMPHPDRSASASDEELKLCLYYPILILFRFMGLRQGNIRECRIMTNPENYAEPDGNIGIKKDGTLVFHYTEKETKNGKKLHAEFNLNQHGETHGQLIRVLTKYLKQVRPFIISTHPHDIQDQCFAYIPRWELRFQRFSALNAQSFNNFFTRWSHIYLADFLNAPERHGLKLNPHYFRGVCCDWLHDVLKFSFDQIGEYIGDRAETVRTEYINRNRVYDPTHYVTLKNIELRLTKKEEEERDAFFESIMRRYHQLEQENDENKDKIKFLEEKLREKDREIEELKKEKKISTEEPEEE